MSLLGTRRRPGRGFGMAPKPSHVRHRHGSPRGSGTKHQQIHPHPWHQGRCSWHPGRRRRPYRRDTKQKLRLDTSQHVEFRVIYPHHEKECITSTQCIASDDLIAGWEPAGTKKHEANLADPDFGAARSKTARSRENEAQPAKTSLSYVLEIM